MKRSEVNRRKTNKQKAHKTHVGTYSYVVSICYMNSVGTHIMYYNNNVVVMSWIEHLWSNQK